MFLLCSVGFYRILVGSMLRLDDNESTPLMEKSTTDGMTVEGCVVSSCICGDDCKRSRSPMEHFRIFCHYTDDVSPSEFLKELVLGLTILPIRFVTCCLLVLSCTILTFLVSLGTDSAENPIYRRRRWLIRSIAYIHCRLFLLVFGFYWIEKPARRPRGAHDETYTLVANHTGWADIMILATTEGASFIAKKAIKNYPGIGVLARMWGSFFIDRADPNQRQKMIDNIKSRQSDPSNPPLLLFPEGTTTNGSALIVFKKGAFIAGTPVQPIILRYPHKRSNIAWDTNSIWHSVFKAGTQFYNRARIEYLPIYYPTDEEKEDPDLYAENVRRYMSQHSGIPATFMRYRHKALYEKYLSGDIDWEEVVSTFYSPGYELESPVDPARLRSFPNLPSGSKLKTPSSPPVTRAVVHQILPLRTD